MGGRVALGCLKSLGNYKLRLSLDVLDYRRNIYKKYLDYLEKGGSDPDWIDVLIIVRNLEMIGCTFNLLEVKNSCKKSAGGK